MVRKPLGVLSAAYNYANFDGDNGEKGITSYMLLSVWYEYTTVHLRPLFE
ncbi:hypothetical protein OK016_05290 [Vibrio chagasii]|nr:hypothetical protein [Vibrio chagasii]